MEGLTRLAGLFLAAALAHTPLTGTWALASGKPLVAAQMRVTNLPGQNVALDIYETKPGATTPVRSYDVDMTKLMHMVVISTDFTQFMHVHPTFDATTGHFAQTIHLDPAHDYYVYADAEPQGIGQQVFRFDLRRAGVGKDSTRPDNSLHAKAAAGPYTVSLSKTTLAANAPSTISITVMRNGALAGDLQPYLGAAAHAVFIDTNTLTYVHVHPTVAGAPAMDMDMGMDDDMGASKVTAKAGPRMTMNVPALAPGTYKLWLQFQGKTGLAVASFTLVAR